MEKKYGLGFFEKYLTLWVTACIIAGIAIGKYPIDSPDFSHLLLGFRLGKEVGASSECLRTSRLDRCQQFF